MEHEDIVKLIEKNLHKIEVGDTFSTATALYSTLGIPVNKKDGNKTIKAAVKLYIEWDLTSALYEKLKTTKEIYVTKINESPEHKDGRSNNGGAHNNTYGPIIKPALLQYSYGEFTTYHEIDEKIYGFEEQDTKAANAYGENKQTSAYKDKLYDYLKAITKTALNGLEREKLLNYKEVFVISGDLGLFDGSGFKINDKTLLADLICKPYEGKPNYQSIILDKFETEMNKAAKGADGYISINELTVMEFLDIARKRKSPIDITKMKNVYSYPKRVSSRPASDEEREFIEDTEEAICEHLGFTRQIMNINSAKRNQVYSRTKIIYNLLGWKSVWKALQIDIQDQAEESTKYPIKDFSHEALLEALEPYMINWAINQTVNWRSVELEKRAKKPTLLLGGYSDIIVGSDEDYPYLANDKKVNKLHCQVFQHPIDEAFFRSYIEQNENSTD